MFLELIATFAAGAGAAGLILMLNKMTKGHLPRWLMPASAGFAMMFMTIWMEMSWADRSGENLPEGVEVAETVTETAWWRPWTLVWPQKTRLIAVDTATIQTNEAAPDIRLVDLYLMGRWSPTNKVPQLIRCTMPARADVTDEVLGKPDQAMWIELPPESAMAQLACKE